MVDFNDRIRTDAGSLSAAGPGPGGGSPPADTGASQQSHLISPPAINIPKGGAIRGIGEKFAANPVTGTGSMTVPIAASPGRSGFGPQLSLSYDSGAGNGPLGFGWSLAGSTGFGNTKFVTTVIT